MEIWKFWNFESSRVNTFKHVKIQKLNISESRFQNLNTFKLATEQSKIGRRETANFHFPQLEQVWNASVLTHQALSPKPQGDFPIYDPPNPAGPPTAEKARKQHPQQSRDC